jgi:hypothetical protein
LSDLFHALHDHWLSGLEPADMQHIIYERVHDTGRRCRRIPRISPYDFGIFFPWLQQARARPENAAILGDWGTHGDPEGLDLDALKDLKARLNRGPGGSTSGVVVVDEELQGLLELANPTGIDPRFDFGSSP